MGKILRTTKNYLSKDWLDMRKRFLSGAVALASTLALTAGVLSPAQAAPAAPNYNPYPGQIHGMVAPQATVRIGHFTAADASKARIYYKVNTVPNAKAAIVVVHGLAEHSGRYDYVTYRLNMAGFNVYRMDHRGHAKSAAPYNNVKKGDVDSFHFLIDDMLRVVKMARRENAGKKVIMLGHSMGAMATQMFETKYPTAVDATVSNGGGVIYNPYGKNTLQPKVITPANLPEANTKLEPTLSEKLPLAEVMGFQGVGPLLIEATKGDPRKIDAKSPQVLHEMEMGNELASGVCSDPRIADDYTKDPLNSKTFTMSTAFQMLISLEYATYNAKAYTRPTLIMHGASDGLVPSAFSVNWYNMVGSKDKSLVFWKGLMHETMNEVTRDEVLDYVVAWINRHL